MATSPITFNLPSPHADIGNRLHDAIAAEYERVILGGITPPQVTGTPVYASGTATAAPIGVVRDFDPALPKGDRTAVVALGGTFTLGKATADGVAAGLKSNAAPPGTLVPMAPRSQHMIRTGDTRGQFTAETGEPPSGAVIVCAHETCAQLEWRDEASLRACHGFGKANSHAWGWFYGGKLYAPIPAPPFGGRAYPPPHPAIKPAPCDGCGAPSVPSKGGFTHCTHADDCPHVLAAAREERRAREAPLVALVAAVPEGLDPVGWRAAVLAVHDAPAAWKSPKACTWDGVTEWAKHRITESVRRFAAGEEWWAGKNTIQDVACAAYRRAIAPHKAPPPERKTRASRLTCDAYDLD